MAMQKGIKLGGIICQDVLSSIIMSSSKEKLLNFYDQPIDSDIKRYEEIRKLAIGQGEGYTTRCLLDYDCIKNHYRLIAVDLT